MSSIPPGASPHLWGLEDVDILSSYEGTFSRVRGPTTSRHSNSLTLAYLCHRRCHTITVWIRAGHFGSAAATTWFVTRRSKRSSASESARARAPRQCGPFFTPRDRPIYRRPGGRAARAWLCLWWKAVCLWTLQKNIQTASRYHATCQGHT